jgi:hypothetical protein
MAQHKKRRFAVIIIYLLLITGIAWQSFALVTKFGPHGKFAQIKSHKVMVQGDVRRPGMYRVPEGTTQFEILKVAGVRPTSDLSTFNLMSAVGENGEIIVDSRETAAGVRAQSIAVRLEFYYGDISITGKDGRSVPAQEGIVLSEGDRIATELSSQVELSIGSFSRVDLDAFSELTFDRLSIADNGNITLDLFQKMGVCWYKIAYADKNEAYRVVIPGGSVSIAGSGADFLVDIQPDQTTINCTDGQLGIERTGGTESINLITGQSATLYNDGRPIQVSRLAPDMSATERFSQLTQEKKSVTLRGQPLNFLFCGTPAVFFAISVQFDKGIIYTIDIPPRLVVEQFTQGIYTLDEAFLYGGPALANSIIERILNIRLTRYTQFTRDDILKTADILGGLNATLDAKASAQLKMKMGANKLMSQNLAAYLSSARNSPEEVEVHERQLLGSLIQGIRDKSIVLTPPTTAQILSLIESNFTTQEVMDFYLRLSTSSSVLQKHVNLPVHEQRTKGRLVFEPDLEKCRAIVKAN